MLSLFFLCPRLRSPCSIPTRHQHPSSPQFTSHSLFLCLSLCCRENGERKRRGEKNYGNEPLGERRRGIDFGVSLHSPFRLRRRWKKSESRRGMRGDVEWEALREHFHLEALVILFFFFAPPLLLPPLSAWYNLQLCSPFGRGS